jgi:hypothetical protein
MSIEERRLGSDLKLYNFNIVREAPYISREITRYRWEDGAKVSYQTLVWGKPDDLDNKFPDTAESEGPGDPDADEPVAVDGGALIPSALADKAGEAILAAKLQAQNVKAQAQSLLTSLGPAADSRELLTEEAFNLRALILEAKRVLAGGTQEDFTPPTQADSKQYARRLQSNGSVVNFNIDRKKPYRDIKRTITERGETIENANVRLYGDLADLDTYFPLTLEV